jgi:hypothetical protein
VGTCPTGWACCPDGGCCAPPGICVTGGCAAP